jgi:uncharacterized Tic20 family protein
MSNDLNRPEEPVVEEPAEASPEDALAMPSEEARNLAMFCHLLGFAGFVVPFGSILGPLVLWLIKREDHPFVDDQGKQALNWQISIFIYAIIATFMIVVLIGLLLLPAVLIMWLVFTIVGAVKAQKGIAYRYPLTIPFVK